MLCPSYIFHKTGNISPLSSPLQLLIMLPHLLLLPLLRLRGTANPSLSLSVSLSRSLSIYYLFTPQVLSSTVVSFFSFSSAKDLARNRERSREREMGRGRLEIKKIENPTSRQVTYSKRRAGIMKKARELTVLCDAQVSVIMFSSTGKFADYCSPSTNTKRIVDRYQQLTGIDLWKDQYEKMQSTLRNLEEINCNLRKEIRQRMGEDLDGLGFEELRGLEQSLDETLMHVRQRKYHMISTQTDTYKKKVKSTHEAHRSLLRELGMKDANQDYGFVAEDALSIASGGTHVFAFRVQPSQPNLLGLGYGPHDLSLA